MANIYDIAKHANVSPATVSRAINKSGYVSKETYAIIMKSVEILDYRKNIHAVHLSTGSTKVIGVIIPDNTHCYDTFVKGVLQEAINNGYEILLMPTYFDATIELEHLNKLKDKRVDGIILTSRSNDIEVLQAFNDEGYRLIVCERDLPQGIASVFTKRYEVYREMFKTFQAKGKNRIAITVARESQSLKELMRAFHEFYTPENIVYYRSDAHHFDDGRACALEMFRSQQVPDAIYTHSDDHAAGIITGALSLGYHVGKDYIIVGEDNLTLSQVMDFSTIQLNLDTVGATAVQALLSDETQSEGIEAEFIPRNI